MIIGVIKNKVDKVWTDLWASDITNPLTVMVSSAHQSIFVR